MYLVFSMVWSTLVNRMEQGGTAEAVQVAEERSLLFWCLLPVHSVTPARNGIFQKVA